MLKIVVRRPDAYRAVQRVPLVKKLFVYDFAALESLSDDELANAVYKTIFVENSRTSKHTAPGRLADADDMLVKHLDRPTPHVIHDVAVSSGVTSLDLRASLERAGIRAQLFISDKYATFYIGGRRLRRIYDANGNALKFYVGAVLADRTATDFFPLSIALYHIVRALDRRAPPPATLRQVKLYHPAVLRELRLGALHELEYDVFETRLPPRFTCVRAMNILNRRCFAPQMLLKAMENLRLSLREGGVLQVGRTAEDGKTEASVYRNVNGRLALVADLNGGSELKPLLVDSLAA